MEPDQGGIVEVEVLKSLNDDMILWRYMSLDKFVNLLDDGGVYFSPLDSYMTSDPYEGFPPAVAIKAMYSASDPVYKNVFDLLSSLESAADEKTPEFLGAIRKAKDHLATRSAVFRKVFNSLSKGTLVSCWYHSEYQSEAMWKLYSDQGKGVAVKTTIGKLRVALESAIATERQTKIFLGKVKYLDYSDAAIAPSDCVVDGHIMPLLKRVSYSHENEVRAFLCPDLDVNNLDDFVIKPYMAHCDVFSLIDGVYVSPFVRSPYVKAVRAIVKSFGLSCSVEQSSLLAGAEDLFHWLGRGEQV
ncbi:DUF2971 domain-containing protein [Pseudomonas synxantha]|uniref:DUF2971 domain-containing protein n=1 Tax=Pseudomonas synxantha TaxID=47883 RepID=UPI0006145D69|nr:DUF2971 domain-containing protein [Pseudomonas synxantha]